MGSDRISIDLSEFLNYDEDDCTEILKGIREHMQQVRSCTEIEKVELLGPTGFYLPEDEMDRKCPKDRYPIYCSNLSCYPQQFLKLNVGALKALFPEPSQQRTIQRVEFSFPNGFLGHEASRQHCPAHIDENPPELEGHGGSLTVNTLCFYRHFRSDEPVHLATEYDFFYTAPHVTEPGCQIPAYSVCVSL